jgi:hypothetical protein
MGTEVGNGVQDSDEGKGKKTSPTPTSDSGQDGPASDKDSEELDPLGEAKSGSGGTDVDGSVDMGGLPTSAANGAGNLPQHVAAQPLAVRLLGAACASPLSQTLQSPLRLQEITAGAVDPIDVTAAKTADTWTVSVPSHGDLFKVLASPVAALPYSVAVMTPEGEPLEQGFECGEATTDDGASLPGISGVLQKVALDMWLDDVAYKVTWYLKAAGSSHTLERFEVEDVGADHTTVLTASPLE